MKSKIGSILLLAISMVGQAGPQGVEYLNTLQGRPDSLNQVPETLNVNSFDYSDKEEKKVLEENTEHIPHLSYWNKAEDELFQFLKTSINNIFSPQVAQWVIQILDVIYKTPLIFLVLFSLLFIVNVIAISFILFMTLILKNTWLEYEKRMSSDLEKTVTEYLFREDEADEIIAKLRRYRSRRALNLLIRILFNYLQNLSGESRGKIIELYKILALYKLSIKKTSSWFIYKRVKGIRELSNLYPSHAKKIILRHVEDKNDLVSSEAQIAFAYLDRDTSFTFLDDLHKPFSKWSQLNILNLVRIHARTVPSFDKWLDSANKDVVIFSIRMIHYFQQNENAPFLIRKLQHPDEEVRFYAYRALKRLNYSAAKKVLKANFNTESFRNKIEILKMIGNIGDKDDLMFLKNILEENNVSIRLQTCKTLYSLGEVGEVFLNEFNKEAGWIFSPYIDHIKKSGTNGNNR
jgi:hypothetical protein